ncbi:g-patch domain containing protein [Ophiostoma piceae UAMH 11346]|uniref:G-patch domain containing protein n=1 Tax=Ophiostoma piceae (strain UAMH 11346) TaxID=1262450 RepID=S3BMT7_OPHP1|nr:g-patch domain containing protein [Ophiostoma piceae UAMH 11346]
MPRADKHPSELNEDGASDVPLHRLPGFGTGLHRQRVTFVKAGEAPVDKPATPATSGGGSVSDVYLSIVMGGSIKTAKEEGTKAASAVCEICRLPTTPSASSSSSSSAPNHHDACLVHQVALEHSKPPSSLDRGRFGLAIMSAQGWDPDSGRGLGRDQQGMPYPIEAKKRLERQALGDKRKDDKTKNGAKKTLDTRPRTKKDIKRMEEEKRRRHNRLHEQIMGNSDLDKYLRPQE